MKKNLRDKRFTASIKISNLTISQSIALEDMLSNWQTLGSVGASRWTSFFADGDGNFRPRILYNGHPPTKTDLLKEEDTWRGSEYRIDFDSIAWKLHDHEDAQEIEAKKFNIFRVLFGSIRFSILYAIKDLKLQLSLNKIRRENKKCQKLPATEVQCDESPEEPCDSDQCS